MSAEILFYISGVITTISLVGFIYYRSKYINTLLIHSNKDDEILKLKDQNRLLLEYKSNRESKKRTGKLKTDGWHMVKDNDKPNKKTWEVVFELKEVGQSIEDEHKYKFDVINVFPDDTSSAIGDVWKKEDYINWFNGHYGGGWINTKSKSFEWVINLSKLEIRDDKLDELGIK